MKPIAGARVGQEDGDDDGLDDPMGGAGAESGDKDKVGQWAP